MTAESILVEKEYVAGAYGQLECRLSYSGDGQPSHTLIVAGPHPYMGGELNNNLVSQLCADTAAAGGLAVSFNYSGTGASSGPAVDVAAAMNQFWETGEAPQDPVLVEDFATMCNYAQQLVDVPLFGCGYSFGCYAVASRLNCHRFRAVILISPTLGRHDFSILNRVRMPVLLCFSDNDFLTSRQQMDAWLARHACIVRQHCVCGAEHFFRGREHEVAAVCRQFIREQLS